MLPLCLVSFYGPGQLQGQDDIFMLNCMTAKQMHDSYTPSIGQADWEIKTENP